MSWGTSYKQDVYISRRTYSSKFELKDEIEEIKERIASGKAELMSLCCCTPKDIVVNKDDVDDALDVIQRKFYDLWDIIKDDIITLYKLEGLLENFDNKIEG